MKYGNQKTRFNGLLFDSKAEAHRYEYLRLLEKAGHITGLTLQVAFVLAPKVKYAGEKRSKPALRYVADFVYSDIKTGGIVVEDVKSSATANLAVFRLKRHLMLSVLGIDVKVVK